MACLGCVCTDTAVDELIEVGTDLCTEKYLASLRKSAADKLGEIGEPSVDPLMALATEDEWACDTLKDVGADAVPALFTTLATEKWPEAVLADMGGPAIEASVEQLSSEDGLAVHRALGVLLRMFENMKPAADAVLLDVEMAPVLLADLVTRPFAEENEASREEGFDHQFMAELALASMGEPVASTILWSNYEDKWYVLQMMGEEAVPLLTSTMKGKNRDNAITSSMCLVYMGKDEPSAVKWFTDTLANKDLKSIASYYMYYIALGQEGSEQVISDALIKYGSKQMALDCLNSGNDKLDAAGRKWASKHGYRVYKSSKETSAVPWGV